MDSILLIQHATLYLTFHCRDLLSLDGEELLIQLYAKRGMKKKDKFLGQSQLTISALGLSKESEWHYLTDRPESERMANSNGMTLPKVTKLILTSF